MNATGTINVVLGLNARKQIQIGTATARSRLAREDGAQSRIVTRQKGLAASAFSQPRGLSLPRCCLRGLDSSCCQTL